MKMKGKGTVENSEGVWEKFYNGGGVRYGHRRRAYLYFLFVSGDLVLFFYFLKNF